MALTAYFDCFSGISGDMCLAALSHLGADMDQLQKVLEDLPLPEIRVESREMSRMGISGRQVRIHGEQEHGNHHHGRTWADIRDLVENSGLTDSVKSQSLAVFERLAIAEGKIHNADPETVHFHEVGGVDSIADIVGTAWALEELGITRVVCSALPLGTGFVKCDHGILPVPAPATVELLTGVPVYGTQVPHELVTPTGAALASTLAAGFGPMPPMKVEKIGYGFGTRELEDRPNGLRIFLGQEESTLLTDRVTVLETNIDDMSPELLGFLMERLFEQGALDVLFIPAQAKKNRPAVMVQVVSPPERAEELCQCLLTESTSIGVRMNSMERRKLARKIVTIQTPLGKMQAKEITRPDGSAWLAPEYEECRRAAKENHLALPKVYQMVYAALEKAGKIQE